MLFFRCIIFIPILFLLSSLQELSAGGRPENLDTYFKTFTIGEKVEKSDSWFSPDKGYHIVGSMISTTFISQLSQKGFDSTLKESQYIGAGMTFSFGLAKELYDSGKPNNMFSWKDLTANCVGIILGVILSGVQ